MRLPSRQSDLLLATLLLLIAAGLGACEGIVDSEKVESVVVTGPEGPILKGSTRQLTAVVLDAAGNAVDADVRWSSSRPEIASISAEGLVIARSIGEATIAATAGGVNSAPVRLLVQEFIVDLGVDSIFLKGWGCKASLYAQVGPAAMGVSYTATDPSILEFYTIRTTGTTRSLRAGLFAVAEGATEVIATHVSGAADTVLVTIGDAQARARLSAFGVLNVGVPEQVSAQLVGACGFTTFSEPWWGSGPELHPAEIVSLSPDVVTVDTIDHVFPDTVYAVPYLTAHRFGTALIEARFGPVRDTTELKALESALLPRDTTIHVGESVTFRGFVSDSTGTLAPAVPNRMHTFRNPADQLEGGVYVGSEVVVDTIRAIFWSDVIGAPGTLTQTAIVRVVQ